MKYLPFFFFMGVFIQVNSFYSQNPGLAISEVYINPPGTDSCKEYVELIATKYINFQQTPYTIIVNNNGVATTQGWVAGGTLTYAFEINQGTVSTGQVVYVGGSCMTPTQNVIKALNVKYVNGDGGIGTANAAGVFGNGGANADGIAVFDKPVSQITSSTVPTDAVFWGTGLGTSIVNAGMDGYQLPVNDFYSGGKLNSGSYYAPDPNADILTLSGTFNTSSNSWVTPRTAAITPSTAMSYSSSISLTSNSTGPMAFAFLKNDTSVTENNTLVNIYVKINSSSTSSSQINIVVSNWSNASSSDYTLAATTLSVAAHTPSNTSFPITFTINNDNIQENDEYVILRISAVSNASIVASASLCALYINDDDTPTPMPSNALTLQLLSSFSNSLSGSNSAEIVVHDPTTQRLYIANSAGNKLDIVNFINPSSPSLIASVPMATLGSINSVAVKNGTVAVALENNTNPQDSGRIAFFDANGNFIKSVKAGMMPDMVCFNHAGTRVLTANEGEPNANYSVSPTNDPDGSITIVDITPGVQNITQSNVSHITFTVYNGQEATLKAQGIRIYGPHNIASKDFEPEYIAISPDDSKAWVTLQENNAIVEINLTNNTINWIKALGTKDYNNALNAMDVSDQTFGVNISNFPVKAFYQPDAIYSYSVGSNVYLVTANEGDAREYATFNEERRVSQLNLDPTLFPNQADLKHNSVLGRLRCTNRNGDIDNDNDFDTLYVYGGRSFSIWNATTGNLVYDSRNDFERITSKNTFSVMFNANNTVATKKDRSDDKGPEPEGVAIGKIGNNVYAFIALERIGGVMVYDITNPASPVYITYVNNRNITTNGPDRGAEGVIFIPQSESPNGMHIVIAANEISSSLSIWGIPGCTSPVSTSVAVSGSTPYCSSTPPVISVTGNTATLNYQWYQGTVAISGATSSTFAPTSSGSYYALLSGAPGCSAQTLPQTLSINPSPTITLSATNVSVCSGQSATLAASGAQSYTWNPGGSNASSIVITPSASVVYTVTGTSSAGCLSSGNNTASITLNTTPTISVNSGTICSGQSFTITPTGAASYTVQGGTFVVSPTVSTSYTVIGASAAGCLSSNTATSDITVNPSPNVAIQGASNICAGNTLTLSATGANSYTWSTNANTNSITVSPSVTTTYSVTGTNTIGCSKTSTATVIVHPLPPVSASSSGTICAGASATLT
ncbi:MAG: choice-of-anchor I family protein, partial [Bacteroidia bacterium]|nr:choice-of-anchor I family protein [Bacteroidia bacterium]